MEKSNSKCVEIVSFCSYLNIFDDNNKEFMRYVFTLHHRSRSRNYLEWVLGFNFYWSMPNDFYTMKVPHSYDDKTMWRTIIATDNNDWSED